VADAITASQFEAASRASAAGGEHQVNEPRKTILVMQVGVNLWPECGGVYKCVCDFKDACDALGHRSEIHSFDQVSGTKNDSITHHSVIGWPVSSYIDVSPAALGRELKERVLRADCVIIHGVQSLSATLVARFALKRHVPLVVVAHGGLDPWLFTYRSWRKRIWLWFFRKELVTAPDVLIFSTEQEREKAKQFVSRSSPVVIHWPVVTPEVDRKLDATSRVRQRLKLPTDAKILLFCGRIHPLKRVLETVKAFGAAQACSWFLLLVGPFCKEINQERLTAACAASGGHAVIAGPLFGEDLADCYRGASAFVSFSLRENFGYTVAEASSFGIPVLISRGIALHSDVVRRGAGRVCADESEEGMRRAIAEFCGLPDAELEAMGKCGRRWVEEELSPVQFAKSIDSVFQRIVHRKELARRDSYQGQSTVNAV
jgi:glycosyltransferase involved in cell wall biosynthesis